MSKLHWRAYSTRSAQVIEVLRIIRLGGDGESDSAREIVEYWSKEGEFLAMYDPCSLTTHPNTAEVQG